MYKFLKNLSRIILNSTRRLSESLNKNIKTTIKPIIKPIQKFSSFLTHGINILFFPIQWITELVYQVIKILVTKIFDNFLIYLISVFGTILYIQSVFLNDANPSNLSKDIAMFSVTFSVGLAALLIAAVSLTKVYSDRFKHEIINYVKAIVTYVLFNFLLLLSSYTDIENVINGFTYVAIGLTIYIIFATRAFLEELVKLLKQDL